VNWPLHQTIDVAYEEPKRNALKNWSNPFAGPFVLVVVPGEVPIQHEI
jgi:hypothetical protein